MSFDEKMGSALFVSSRSAISLFCGSFFAEPFNMLRQIKLPMCKAAFIGKLEQEALLDLARHFINAVIAKTRFCYIDRCIIICCPYKKVKRTAFDKKETCYEPDHRLLFPPRQYGNIALQAKNDLNCEAIKIVPEEAYGNYISAYVLTLVCIRIAKSAGHTKQNVDMVMDKVPVLRRYFHDISFNMHVSLYRSLGLNVFYAIMKLGFSIYYRSVWFGTLSGYYFFLAVMRFVLLRYSGKSEFGKNLSAEWRRYRLCGVILLLMNLALTGVVIMVARKNEGFHYPGMLIYIMAMYAFYSITAAIINVVKYRKYRSPVMSAAKVLHLAAALVSMLALETAMLAQFGGNNSAQFREIMTGCTGGCVCAMILAIAVYMICHATKEIRILKAEEAK